MPLDSQPPVDQPNGNEQLDRTLAAIERWLDSDAFWQVEACKEIFRFGAGPLDCISRDQLRAIWAAANTGLSYQHGPEAGMLPACGDIDCTTCELVPFSSKP
ncbi:hypothetical protein [Cupriavidus sp. H18C2]|uniref:hypothetical protein n=1 Tax=Cupriavidus sp. H18C2 TaxID=3241602 RepID=UPI003BF89822